MAFEYLTNVPLTQAGQEYQALLLQNGFAPRVENIAVTEACGRYTAEAVYAHICAPHYMASAMDGIALRAKDTFGAGERTPVTLRPEQFTNRKHFRTIVIHATAHHHSCNRDK